MKYTNDCKIKPQILNFKSYHCSIDGDRKIEKPDVKE